MPKEATQAVRTRAPKIDQVLAKAVDVARQSAETLAYPRPIGEHLGFTMDADRLGTHWFASSDPGYVGWAWAVTLARVPRSRTATVCEVDMIPREGALLAPEWVPWEERLRPGDLSREDALPYQAEDARLEQSFEDVGDDPDIAEFAEIGLGRKRVLSDEGRQAAVARWYKSDQGPKPGRPPKNTCSTCGFLLKMAGSMRTVFGVCANEWAPDDGRVVSLDHTCGAHSETDVPKQASVWTVRPSRVDDSAVVSEPMPKTGAAPKE